MPDGDDKDHGKRNQKDRVEYAENEFAAGPVNPDETALLF